MNDDWRDEANCLSSDPAIFFPETPHGGLVTRIYAVARAICSECDVREECLDAAMREEIGGQGWRAGMRGGMTPSERDQHAKKVRFCASCGGRFTPRGKSPYCSDECFRAERAEATARWREKVA